MIHNVGIVAMENLKDICQFIDKHRLQGERVLLACKGGRAHCVASAVAYLMHENGGKISKSEALKMVQKCRNDVIMNGEWLRVIN